MKQFAILIFLFINITASAQINEETPQKFYFGISPTGGYFNPSGANNYINNEIEKNGQVKMNKNTNIYSNYGLNIMGKYYIKRFDISLHAESIFAIESALKAISSSAYSYYTFSRISYGLTGNYYFPIGKKWLSFYCGIGVLENMMFLRSLHGNAIGGRIQGGIDANFKKFRAKYIIRANAMPSAKAKSGNDVVKLNYSGIDLGLIFEFRL